MRPKNIPPQQYPVLTVCDDCGKPCLDNLCPDCRYRNGGTLPEKSEEYHVPDLVEIFERNARGCKGWWPEG